jgi:hypothetical protein
VNTPDSCCFKWNVLRVVMPSACDRHLVPRPTNRPKHRVSLRRTVLPWSALSQADFESNQSSADLGSKATLSSHSQKAQLGDCDAFLSHSWHGELRMT